ncbi:hypothetical protein KSS87_007091 [Heliosperma pusillum]|nr:hypothetical protein KSS87_007091 [Heliosperma pusillum]
MEDEDEKKLLEDVFGESSSSSSDSDTYPELNYNNPNWAMRFGDLPSWAVKLSDHIYKAVCIGSKETDMGELSSDNDVGILPSRLLQRDPLFDQLIINLYQPGEGICAHVDLMRFEDGIAIVSLESACVMHFTPVECDGKEVPLAMKVPVNLTPGSLVVMWGDARYKWKHEINRKPGFQVWQGLEIEQRKRTSVTLRKLCEEPVELT